MSVDHLIKTKSDTTEVTKGAEKIKKEMDKTQEAVDGLNKQLDKFTNGAATAFNDLVKGAKAGINALTTLKGAVIATGLGALVVAAGSLFAYFTRTEEGAEKLRLVMAALGAITGTIIDRFSDLGKAIFEAINNPRQALDDFVNAIRTYFLEFIPNTIKRVIDNFGVLGSAIKKAFDGDFKGAFELGKKGMVELLDAVTDLNPATMLVKNLAKEVIEVGKAATVTAQNAVNLEKQMNRLLKVERDLALDRARSNALIEEQKLIAEDVTKSVEERIAATERAAKIEQDILNREIAAQKERVELIRQQNDLTNSTEADVQKLYDAQIQLANLQAQSLPKQIELQNKLNSIRAEAAAKEKELRDKANADLMLGLENQLIQEQVFGEKRLEVLQSILDRQMELELQNTELTENEKEAIRLKYLQKKEALVEKSANSEVKTEEQKNGAILGLTGQAIGAASQFASKNEKTQKRFAAAAALANTGQAITATLATQAANPSSILFPGFPFVQAAIIGAAGFAQVRNILSGASGGSAPTLPSSSASGSGGVAPNTNAEIDLSFLRQGANTEQQTFARAFILPTDLNNRVEIESNINNQTTF